MQDSVRRAWLNLCLTILDGALPRGYDRRDAVARHAFEHVLGIAEAALDATSGSWEGARPLVAAKLNWLQGDDAVAFPTHRHATRLKCIELAWRLQAGDNASLSACELEFLLAAMPDTPTRRSLSRRDRPRAIGDAMRPGAVATLAFAFAHKVPGIAGLSGGRGDAVVECIPADEAPVAIELSNADSGAMRFRVHDGILYRPVLAPGSTRGCSLEEFVDAAGTGLPWVDNPFLPRRSRQSLRAGGTVLGVADAVGARKGPPAAVTAAGAAACLARAGRLIVVDGVVHRDTALPTVHLVRHHAPSGTRRRLGWALSGVMEDATPQGTLAVEGTREAWSGDPGTEADFAWLDLPITSLDGSRAMARDLADLMAKHLPEHLREGWSTQDGIDVSFPIPHLLPHTPRDHVRKALAGALEAGAMAPQTEGRPADTGWARLFPHDEVASADAANLARLRDLVVADARRVLGGDGTATQGTRRLTLAAALMAAEREAWLDEPVDEDLAAFPG